MKKILLTLFQIAVTVGMLIWVFHDPNQRAKMAEALRTADYRWVGAGILSYVLVEVFAAFRLANSAARAKNPTQFSAGRRIVSYRHVL